MITIQEIYLDVTDNKSIQSLCKKDKHLAKLISMVGTLKYTIHSDGYSFLVHEIIEQMLSIKAGAKIYDCLLQLCGGNISPLKINALSEDEIKSIGTSQNKVNYIKYLTKAIMDNPLSLEELSNLSDKEAIATLTSLRGIGNWIVLPPLNLLYAICFLLSQ